MHPLNSIFYIEKSNTRGHRVNGSFGTVLFSALKEMGITITAVVPNADKSDSVTVTRDSDGKQQTKVFAGGNAISFIKSLRKTHWV